jgi:PBP4 family serine-type D-alanyl-D-alanine carboxypeptidase
MCVSLTRRTAFAGLSLCSLGVWCLSSTVAANPGLPVRINEIMSRPALNGASWGIKFYAPERDEVIYSLNSNQLFAPASAAKVFIAGATFEELHKHFRFDTKVYRAGSVVDGILQGDLVLVASGDLISGRVQADGSIAVPDPDHTNDPFPGVGPVPGDPLRAFRNLAEQVAASGITRVDGRVLVDDSLFRGAERLGIGTTVISSMMTNDNLVDVTARPGSAVGDPAVLEVSPQADYLTIINEVVTVAADAPPPPPLAFVDDTTAPNGSHTVTLRGNVRLGGQAFRTYQITEPAKYAASAFAAALRDEGVDAHADLAAIPDFEALGVYYKHRNEAASHLSPPLEDALKPTMKVSSNLHAAMLPYIIGALAEKDKDDPERAGYEARLDLFLKAGLDPQAPGIAPYDPNAAGLHGISDSRYTPDFFVQFLDFMRERPYFDQYRDSFAMLGRDGDLKDLLPTSPAAGNVYAKSGTAILMGPVLIKTLVGYIELPDGEPIVFSALSTITLSTPNPQIIRNELNQALGDIVAAVYESETATYVSWRNSR